MRPKIGTSVRGAIAFAMGAILVLIQPPPASGRASGLSREHWSETRVQGLPQEIRDAIRHVAGSCGTPLSAGSAFDRYLQDGAGNRFIALHFNDLRCDHQLVCNSSGCLHQVYVSRGHGYRLVWSGFVQDVELKQIGTSAALGVTCSIESSRCSGVLRWSGSGFASTRLNH